MEGTTVPYSLIFCTELTLYRPLSNAPIFFPGRLPHPSQGSVLGGVRFNNPNGIKKPYRIGILAVAVAVLPVTVLDVIVIVLLAIIALDPVRFCLW